MNKSNNKKKVVYHVNTSYEDFDGGDGGDGYEDHGLALEYPPDSEENHEVPGSNFGVRNRKKKKPPKFDFIDSYEDSSISQEVYHTTPYAVTRPLKKSPTTYTATTKLHKIRTTTKDPLFDILDTEDLRNAFQSGRHRYKLEAYKKSKEPNNFVLLSSKNPPSNTYQKATSKTPFIINASSGEASGEHSFKIPKVKPFNSYERPATSLESDYESYEIAERDFGLRKNFNHKRKNARAEGANSRIDTSIERIEVADAKLKTEEFVKATTMKPYSRFNPDVHFTKTFSSKIEQQPRETSIWNGQAIPGNHKLARRGST